MQRLLEGIHHIRREAFGCSRELFNRPSCNGEHPPALVITCADAGLLVERITQSHSDGFYCASGLGTFVPPASAADGHECDSIAASGAVPHDRIIALQGRIHRAGLEFVKMELLYNFDGQPGFSRGQGQ